MSAYQSRYIETLHYRHDGIVVTNRYFTAGAARYRMNELSDLAQSHVPAHPAVAMGVAVAAVGVAVVVPALMLERTVLAIVIAVPVFVGAGVVSLVSARRRPVYRELVARHRGRLVTLFATTDAHQFGQVSRALLRAFELAHSREGIRGGERDVR
jgi:hypothetical protein